MSSPSKSKSQVLNHILSKKTDDYFLGVQPIVSYFFETDNISKVKNHVLNVRSDVSENLSSLIKECVGDSRYPHGNTIYINNSAIVDMSMFLQALDRKNENRGEAFSFIAGYLDTHSDTYPYVYTPPYTIQNPGESAIPSGESKVSSSLLLPTIALSSYYFMSKLS